LPAKITPDKVEMVVRLRENGHTRESAARIAGVSTSYIRKLETGFDNNGQGWREARKIKQIRGPIPYKDLCPEAKRAWDDIAYFARRYFGLVVMPYQVEAVGKIQEWLESDREEYVVINQPPGTGKSTFYTRVLPAWLTIRDRTLRGMIVSNSQTTADTYLIALRRRLEEPAALRASPQDLKAGIAVDAETSIIADFGLFKAPGADSGDKWSMKAFQVMQMPGYPPGDKEHTWQAFGQGGRFMGTRLDVIIADDVYDPTAIQTAEAGRRSAPGSRSRWSPASNRAASCCWSGSGCTPTTSTATSSTRSSWSTTTTTRSKTPPCAPPCTTTSCTRRTTTSCAKGITARTPRRGRTAACSTRAGCRGGR
jgi:hypothetical protein